MKLGLDLTWWLIISVLLEDDRDLTMCSGRKKIVHLASKHVGNAVGSIIWIVLQLHKKYIIFSEIYCTSNSTSPGRIIWFTQFCPKGSWSKPRIAADKCCHIIRMLYTNGSAKPACLYSLAKPMDGFSLDEKLSHLRVMHKETLKISHRVLLSSFFVLSWFGSGCWTVKRVACMNS